MDFNSQHAGWDILGGRSSTILKLLRFEKLCHKEQAGKELMMEHNMKKMEGIYGKTFQEDQFRCHHIQESDALREKIR